MKAEVVLLIMNLSCSDPQMSFRDFVARYFVPPAPSGAFRWGYPGETIDAVLIRQLDASGDYIEYRVARAEKCNAPIER